MDTLNYNYMLNRFTTNNSTVEIYIYTQLYISPYENIYYVLADHTWEVVVNNNDGWTEEHQVGNVTDMPVYLPSDVNVNVDYEGQTITLNLPELVIDYRSWDYTIELEISDDQIDMYIYNYDDVEITSAAIMLGGDEVNSQYLTIPLATRKEAAIEYFYEDIEPLWEQYDYNNGYQHGKEDGYNEGFLGGYQHGEEDGYNVGQQEGYNNGYNVGQQEGYNSGYNEGYNEGQQNQTALTFGNVISIISDNAANLLEVEILPNFTIGNIIFIPVVFSLIGVIFKFFRR